MAAASTQTVGLTVSIIDQFTQGANKITRGLGKLVTDFRGASKSMKEALSNRWEDSGMNSGILKTTASLYALSRGIREVSEAWMNQESAVNRLDYATRRWGQNSGAVQAMLSGVMAGGGYTQTGAMNGAAELINSRFSASQTGFLMKGVRDLAAFRKPAGVSAGDAMNSMLSGIANGNAGALEPYVRFLPQRMHLLGTDMGELNDPFRRGIAMKALFSILRKEFAESSGDYDRFSHTLEGASDAMKNALIDLSGTLGKALAPWIIKATDYVTRMVKAFHDFAAIHPGLTRVALVLAGIGALWPVLSALVAFLGPIGFALIGISVMVAKWASSADWSRPIGWFQKIWLVSKGVFDMITHMVGSTGSLSIQLYEQLREAGLLPFVLNLFWAFYNLKLMAEQFYDGFADGMNVMAQWASAVASGVEFLANNVLGLNVHFGELTKWMAFAKTLGQLLAFVIGGLLVTAVVGLGTALLATLPQLTMFLLTALAIYEVIQAIAMAVRGLVWVAGFASGAIKERLKGPASDGAMTAAGMREASAMTGVMGDSFGTWKGMTAPFGLFSGNKTGTLTNAQQDAAGMNKLTATVDPEFLRVMKSLVGRPIEANVNIDGQQMYDNTQFYEALNGTSAMSGWTPNGIMGSN